SNLVDVQLCDSSGMLVLTGTLLTRPASPEQIHAALMLVLTGTLLTRPASPEQIHAALSAAGTQDDSGLMDARFSRRYSCGHFRYR
ncbi:hypothetical protein, partial [Mycobacterium marinum]|uniref:hypothetical protein n=1 Tax=Mycobacterium marinum TaxID=1781 RepID=UPI001AA04564